MNNLIVIANKERSLLCFVCGGQEVTISRQPFIDHQVHGIRKLVVEDINNAKEIAKLDNVDEIFIQSEQDVYVAYGNGIDSAKFKEGETISFRGKTGKVIWKDSYTPPLNPVLGWGGLIGGIVGVPLSIACIVLLPGPYKLVGVGGLISSVGGIIHTLPSVLAEPDYGLIESISVPI